MQQYFFILGNNPTLSVAEILALFPQSASFELLSEQVFLLESEGFDAQEIIRKLGGTIKIGVIKGELPAGDYKKMAESLVGLIDIEKAEGKFKYGISYYGKGRLNIKPIGMEVKNFFKDAGKSARWVISREPVLSSVVVEQNKLVGKGAEFVLIPHGGKVMVGLTGAVQPFKELSFRDYGRPGRDDLSGMLPPKLAQIMINLTGGDKAGILLDPFCGSGTVVTEAALMGYKKVIGSDISQKAVEDSKMNLEWMGKNFRFPVSGFQLLNLSATELSQKIKPESVDAIATEPYLGPQRGRVDIKRTIVELNRLYSDSIREFKKVLKPGGRAVMVWPVFAQAPRFLDPDLAGMKTVNPLPEKLRQVKTLKLTGRNTIIYGREGQKVWREIVVMEK